MEISNCVNIFKAILTWMDGSVSTFHFALCDESRFSQLRIRNFKTLRKCWHLLSFYSQGRFQGRDLPYRISVQKSLNLQIQRLNASLCVYLEQEMWLCSGGSRISRTRDIKPKGWGSNLLLWPIFFQKLNENEEQLEQEGFVSLANPGFPREEPTPSVRWWGHQTIIGHTLLPKTASKWKTLDWGIRHCLTWWWYLLFERLNGICWRQHESSKPPWRCQMI